MPPEVSMGRTSDARARLIQSAKELLAMRGFNAVGVSELCDRADVRKGSVYHFFPSKQDLAVAAIRAHWECHEGQLSEILRAQVAPLDKIRRYLRLHREESRRCYTESQHVDGCPFANLALELSSQEPAIRAELARTFALWSALLARPIGEAMAAGSIAAGDPAARAQELLAFLEGAILLARARNEPAFLDQLESGALRLLGATA